MVRINKLAKDLGFKNSFLIEKCQEYGFADIKHHANALTDEQVSLLRSKLVDGAEQSVSVKEKSDTPKAKKISTEKKDVDADKAAPKNAEAVPVRRRIPLWKQKAREDLIKGRWKEVTKVSQQKRPRRFEKRTTKEVPKEQAVVPHKEKRVRSR